MSEFPNNYPKMAQSLREVEDEIIKHYSVTEESSVEPYRGNEINLIGGEYNFDFIPGKIPEVKLKPMLFAFDDDYPKGGWEDFEGFFDTIEDAKKHLKGKRFDSAHIVVDGKRVIEGSRFPEWEFKDVADDT